MKRALLAAISGWTLVAAAFCYRLQAWAPDDFYITYRYARNLARGHGFVFNDGERVFGLSDPGLGLLFACLNVVTRVEIPWLASVVFAGALVGTAAVVAYDACHAKALFVESVSAGFLLVTSSFVWSNQGGAATLELLLLVTAAVLVERSEVLAGLLVGLAVWVRPDAGLGVILLAALVYYERRRLPWRYLAVASGVAVSGLVLAWLYFGQPLPNTLGAKLDMASAAADPATGSNFLKRAQLPLGRHYGLLRGLVLIGGALGALEALRRGSRPLRLLVLFGGLLAAAYTVMGVPFFSWYILPAVAALLYGLASLPSLIVRVVPAGSRWHPWARWVLVSALAVPCLMGVARARTLLPSARNPPPRLVVYKAAGEFIRQHSEESARVAYVEIGVLGFYSDRPILDLMGLVTPWARPFVARNDLNAVFMKSPTEFVVASTRGRMDPIITTAWFREHYRSVATIPESDLPQAGVLSIFVRRGSREDDTSSGRFAREGLTGS